MFFVFKSCGGARADRFENEMFQECFKRFQDWLRYEELPPFGTPEYAQVINSHRDFQRPTWLVGAWPMYSIVESRLSPVHWEPLRLQDIYRCPKALLECEEKHQHYQNERNKLKEICDEQAENGQAVDWGTYRTTVRISFMWFGRKSILTCRLETAKAKFPHFIPLECIPEYKLTLARALHGRVKALGTCKLSLLNSDLLQHIFMLSVDA